MKKLIGFIGTYTCYYIGHIAAIVAYSPVLHNPEKRWNEEIHEFIYNVYNKMMIWSVNIQDWAKLNKPWKNIEKK